MKKYLLRVKSWIKSWLVFLDGARHYFRIREFKKSEFYGLDKKIVFVDQLGDPDPALITGYQEEIRDKKAALRFGTDDLKEYSFWSWRACAVSCSEMILKTFGLYKGSTFELVTQLRDKNGYLTKDKWGRQDIGWKHGAIKELFKEFGLNAEIKPYVSLNTLFAEMSRNRLWIVSVKSRNNPGSHMVVVSGFRWNKDKSKLNIHDPYTLGGKGGSLVIEADEFKNVFLNRGILVWKEA